LGDAKRTNIVAILRRKYNGSLTPQPEMWFWKALFPLNGTMIFSILILYATSIGAVKSDLWKETTLIEKVNEKSKTIQGWKCNHCETDFWNTNLARLQFHLSGDNSLRDFTHGYSGVEVCTKVPRDIMDLAKGEMRSKVSSSDSKTKRAAEGSEAVDREGDDRAKTMKQQLLPGVRNKEMLRIKADNSVSNFFDSTATPHSLVDSFYFRQMIKDILDAGPE
jgi:hypothetical protein